MELGSSKFAVESKVLIVAPLINLDNLTYIAFGLGDVDTNILETSEEFVGIAFAVSVNRVEVSEGSSETSDSLGTTSGELLSHFVENY